MSIQYELLIELLVKIFSNVGRQSPKFLADVKTRYTYLNSQLIYVTFTSTLHISLLIYRPQTE